MKGANSSSSRVADAIEQIGKPRERSIWYKLDSEKNPIPCSMEEANKLLGSLRGRRVGFTVINKKLSISTVFMVLDQNHLFGKKPVLFETAALVSPGLKLADCYEARYKTWAEAVAGHRLMVERARADLRRRP